MKEFVIKNGVLEEYKGNGGDVVIPEGVTSIGWRAFYDCKSLKSVTIPNSVTSIGDCAFEGCKKLKSVTMPDSVTSIGKYAFFDCRSLTSVTIPDSVTSIGDYAFCGCESLRNVIIPDSIISIGYKAFRNCKSLTSVTILEGVTSIGEEAFWYCESLTSVTIPNSVTSIGDHAFCGCESLRNVIIPDSVTSIGDSAFCCCTSLKSATMPKIKYVTGVFKGCMALEEINCKGLLFKNGFIIKNGKLYEYVKDEEHITVPDGVTAIGERVFERYFCPTSVTIPDSVTSISKEAFFRCPLLTSVTFSNSIKEIYSESFFECNNLSRVIYFGDVSELPSNLKTKAVPGFIYAMTHGVSKMEPWKDLYMAYIKRNSKTYAKRAATDADLYRVMLENGLLSEKEVKTLMESTKDAQMLAELLKYQHEHFGEKGLDDFSLDAEDPEEKRAKRAAKYREKIAARREQVKNQKGIKGLTFVVTGNLIIVNGYRMSLYEFKDFIREHGGIVRSTLSARTDYLISDHEFSATAEKAAKLGVPILTEEQLLKMVKEG